MRERPIPLSAPDGTVYAYACSRCRRVSQPWVVHPQLDVLPPDAARESRRLAEMCCPDLCPGCRVPAGGLCRECRADARRAFEVLACIGMAACVHRLRSVHDDLLVARSEGRWDVGLELFAEAEDALAALCGVSPETVRGWR